MTDYLEVYNNDPRYKRYVDLCAKDDGVSAEEMLKRATIQMVGDYYKKNPPKEVPTVETMKSGGC